MKVTHDSKQVQGTQAITFGLIRNFLCFFKKKKIIIKVLDFNHYDPNLTSFLSLTWNIFTCTSQYK